MKPAPEYTPGDGSRLHNRMRRRRKKLQNVGPKENGQTKRIKGAITQRVRKHFDRKRLS